MKPIHRKTKLAGNPASHPKYFAEAKLSNGEALKLADPTATRALVSMMDMQAVLGGAASHFGGPSAFAEIMSATHAYMFHQAQKNNKVWHELFHFVNDGGHCENGLYALRANYNWGDLGIDQLKGFRSINSPLTGHGESHLFPEGVYLSNGPLGSAVPQSQGLAMADNLTGNKRITITAVTDGACMEGETRESLAAIPGLAAQGQVNPYVLIISDNNTKLSGRIDEQSFSMIPTFESLKALGWKVMNVEAGHDLEACLHAVEKACEAAAANPKQPIVLHVKTIKGYGVKKTEESASGGHGFPLKTTEGLPAFIAEIYNGKEIPVEFTAWCEALKNNEEAKKASAKSSSVKKEKVQVGVANALIDARKKGLPVVSITSDLPGSTGLAAFRKEFTEASFDVGIAESNMVSTAAGFAKEGYIPVVDTFAQFGVTKGALPLTMASLSGAPVISVFSHAGFQDAADGASHQGLTYMSMVSAIPNTKVFCLSTSKEAYELITQAITEYAANLKADKTPMQYIFFLGRETFVPEVGGASYKIGKAQVLFGGNADAEATIVTTGPLVHQALAAAESLKAKGKNVYVVNVSNVNDVDTDTIIGCLKKSKGKLVTVEDHQMIGGFGALITHALKLKGSDFSLKSLAVNGEFGRSAYSAGELYALHGLDARAIEAAV